jgi:HK97 family phage portal protein
VKETEKKTLQEFNALAASTVGVRELKEMRIMRKSMIDQISVPASESGLTKLLNKPNRYQTQSEWIEQMFGFRELTGEANCWFNRGAIGRQPVEMFIIPRQHLVLRVNQADPWGLVGFKFQNIGMDQDIPLQDLLMWKYSSYVFNSTTYDHLRGWAPLQSALVMVQALNEGDVRLAISNKNGGAAGLAYNKALGMPTPEQKVDMRRQFNEAVNSAEMANKIAILGGDWGYHNFAMSVEAQKILEQYDYGFERLCRVFKTDYGIFESDAKYENKKRSERHWIYSKITPNIYNLRALLSEKMLKEFNLSPETDLIDCDIMSLPELSDDLAEQVAAFKDADWLSDNEKRSGTGYEEKDSEVMNLTPKEIAENRQKRMGESLDREMQELDRDQ